MYLRRSFVATGASETKTRILPSKTAQGRFGAVLFSSRRRQALPPLPLRWPRREWGLIFFLHPFSFFRVWFFSDIDKVVATITLWNKVSPVFPYLDDIRSGADDGQVRVSSARSEDSLQIFTVGVSVRRCSCLSFVVAISTLLSICSTTRFGFFNPLFWWWKITSLCCFGCSPSRCYFSSC